MPGKRLPYRGDGFPRRSSEHYVLKEKSLSKGISTLIMFSLAGVMLGYLIGNFFQWGKGAIIFTCALSLIVAVIVYFAKEDLEKIEIHDLAEAEHKSDDD